MTRFYLFACTFVGQAFLEQSSDDGAFYIGVDYFSFSECVHA